MVLNLVNTCSFGNAGAPLIEDYKSDFYKNKASPLDAPAAVGLPDLVVDDAAADCQPQEGGQAEVVEQQAYRLELRCTVHIQFNSILYFNSHRAIQVFAVFHVIYKLEL